MILLTLNQQEEKVIDKIISAIADYIQIEPMQAAPISILSFPGLEIRQHQRRVLQGGEEINLTRLEYSTLVFLASNPGIVLTKSQIFEAVWNMDSNSCHSSVVNVIYNLLKTPILLPQKILSLFSNLLYIFSFPKYSFINFIANSICGLIHLFL